MGRPRSGVTKVCEACGKEYYVKSCRAATARTCSYECRYKIKHPQSDETKTKIGLANLGRSTWIKGTHLSDETKRKISEARKGKFGLSGPDCPSWRGGITPQNLLIRNSTRYREWRISVLKRDHFTCQICGVHSGDLQADHILSFSQFPEKRFDVDNGRTLCVKCHRSTQTYGNHYPRTKRAEVLV